MTSRPRLEVAEVFRVHGDAYRRSGLPLSPAQARVLSAVVRCRTAALGGHVDECDRCAARRISYNSCRNRHCPKCQGTETARWLDAQSAHLLPVPYAHVVFTLPHLLAPLTLQNPRVFYGLLFRAASRSLTELALDPRHLGARIGFVAVLHTWGQTLHHHPHLHCVVPAGGLATDGARWVACRPGFFLPVRALSALFRGKYLALLEAAYRDGHLSFHGALEPLREPSAFRRLVARARTVDWVVYVKPPFGGPEPVLKYLARYTHRVAISNHRLLSLEDGTVAFRYKDYAHGRRPRTLRLDALEFIRRFLLHTLPTGFVRIRHYGFLANCRRQTDLERCRVLLGQAHPAPAVPTNPPDAEGSAASHHESSGRRCPACRDGHMRLVERFEPGRRPSARAPPLHAAA